MPLPIAAVGAAIGRAAGTRIAGKIGASAVGQDVAASMGANMGRGAALKMGMDNDSRKTPQEYTQRARNDFNIKDVAGY